MKVLLTGASGFVGSHILDQLHAQGIDTAVLLRATSDRSFLKAHLPRLEVRQGSIEDPQGLSHAMIGITHVIHCAGCTKAARISEFYRVNQQGTRNIVEAINSQSGRVQRLLHISSLAAAGPGTAVNPARETEPPHPVSEYGRSKLAAEQEIQNHCRTAYTVLRPPAVYGPRDYGFLSIFQAVKRHVLPRPNKQQALSLVFVRDLAEAVVSCLAVQTVPGKTFFVAGREIVTGRQMAEEIAAQMGHWTVPCPLPAAVFWPVCLIQEIRSRITGKANLLNLQKYAELRAPGWVCDPSLLKAEVGFECKTSLKEGIAETLAWYRNQGWI